MTHSGFLAVGGCISSLSSASRQSRPACTWLAAQGGSPRQGAPRGIKPRSQLNFSQVLLHFSLKEVVSGAPEGGLSFVQVIPDGKINIKSSFIVLLCLSGLTKREGKYWAKATYNFILLICQVPKGAKYWLKRRVRKYYRGPNCSAN